MRIKNTSQYPDDEVRDLVAFGMKGIDTTGVQVNVKNSRHSYRGLTYGGIPLMSPAAKLKSVQRLITIGIGSADRFPKDNMVTSYRWREISEEQYQGLTEREQRRVRVTTYFDPLADRFRYQQEIAVRHPYGGIRSPLVVFMDWREAIVGVAAHEARHHYQMSHRKPTGEVDAEKWAAKRLAAFRAQR